jgi:hypothetical protein
MDYNDWNLLWKMLESYKSVYPTIHNNHAYPEWTQHIIKTDIDPWIKYAQDQEQALRHEGRLKIFEQMSGSRYTNQEGA